MSESAGPLIRIGISSCLLGEKVRYDGGHKRDAFLVETFGRFVEWVPVCPEVEMGLGTPRETKAMAELGIDISSHRSKSVDEFIGRPFDCVITVCDSAKEACPIFPGAGERLHHGFQDPGAFPADQQLEAFRKVRDEIASWLEEFVRRH